MYLNSVQEATTSILKQTYNRNNKTFCMKQDVSNEQILYLCILQTHS